MPVSKSAEPPAAAWSSILANPQVEPLVHTNPDVRLWSVRTGDGSEYLLRSFGRWRPGASLADEYRVLLHLKDSGIPVAVPIVSDDATLAVKDGDDNYVLVPRLAVDNGDHELRPDAAEVCLRIGSALGVLHAALARYPWPVKAYQLDLAHQAFDEGAPKLPTDLRKDSISPHESAAAAALEGLPTQLIHGDCNAGNVLLSDGQVSGFIDLDHLPVGERIYDLAYYLVHSVRAVVARPAATESRGATFLSLVRRYVDGYDATNPLSSAERAALPAAMLAAEVSLTSWSHVLITELQYRAGPDEPATYQLGATSLNWISRHFAHLTEAIGPN
ncbi:phosphotransferase enzyme family protein [Kribbella sp. CA-293567]|uniref:phosphotransferase enzyme family protein n=1 Tax=Kribbella sp. CA-293567 TaxID=3002436 RepID=UPI0022DD3210|nr:phosphotransferase [Kribbella sp. CA-293567]WBQ07616.1 phosphotransferase [Kribbella sp. CA-293567]